MPLPHFLVMLVAVIVVAALTLWASLAVGVPLQVLMLVALSAVVLVRLSARVDRG